MYKVKRFYYPYMYHGTDRKNIPSIKEKGLIPGYIGSLIPNGSLDDYGKYIWFNKNGIALAVWLETDYRNIDWTILAIPTKYLDINSIFKEKKMGQFYIYTKPIPPENIYKITGWIPKCELL